MTVVITFEVCRCWLFAIHLPSPEVTAPAGASS
jgi:hypothetical protein